MLLWNTRIAVITTIMEKTPTRIPSKVSDERSLCAAIASNAIIQLSRTSAHRADRGKAPRRR